MPDDLARRDCIDAFVLAGGESRRMGRDKARLEVGGVPLAVHLSRRLAAHVHRVWLVAKPDSGLEDLGLALLYDSTPVRALVNGLRAALAAPGPPWRLVLACDMPDVALPALDALWAAAQAADAPGSAPRLPGRDAPEPLPSLWHASVASRIDPGWGLAARDWVRGAGLAEWIVPPQRAAELEQCNTAAAWAAWRTRSEGAPP